MTLSRLSENLADGAALTLVYLVAGKLGLMLAFVHASATAVWPPTGIALVALLMLGPRVWPAIFLGAFIVNITTAGSVGTSIGIAAGDHLRGAGGGIPVPTFSRRTLGFHPFPGVFTFSMLSLR